MNADEERTTIDRAEAAIKMILYGLEEKTGKSIDYVSVDTRNWAQLVTEITLTTTVRQ